MSSGDRSANPATSCASGRSSLQRAHIPRSTWKRSGLGMPPPLRRVSEQSAQMPPAGSPLQDVVLTAQIDTNPETSLERLVPLVEFLTAWKLLPNISHWVLQTIRKGYQIQFGSRPPRFIGVLSTEVAPQQVLAMEQEIKALLEKEAIEYVPHSNRETGWTCDCSL